MGAVIGITVSADEDTEGPLLPGHPLYFTDVEYARVVEQARGIPVMLPMVNRPGHLRDLLRLVDGLVVSGEMRLNLRASRPDLAYSSLQALDPRRYQFEASLVRLALEWDVPILGTCRGCQMLNEVSGGALEPIALPQGTVQHFQSAPANQPSHRVRLLRGTRLRRLLGMDELDVNSFHRQAITRVGPRFRVAAVADDGVVEAIECPEHPFALGLQFHPERLVEANPVFLHPFRALVAAAGQYRRARHRRPAAPGSGI